MKLLKLILRLFTKETSIEAIIAPVARIRDELENYAAEQTRLAMEKAETAEKLLKEAAQRDSQATDARGMADRYAKLITLSAAE